ncbi:Non-specific serine/threonine protein kinase protein [Dioscorea alata]|uniref:Non-specific serine/threonine protein kinase protein n=1 Tax=Dioscorea alata TaxID=55571 RepID=A0ACB7USX6_DIOAL|nr:Non-specific serine/threonine protein kinase protein [Dioscorea alata]
MSSNSIHFSTTLLLLLINFITMSHCMQSQQTQALLEFKNHLNDPLNYLTTWTSSLPPCQFHGIICNSNSSEIIGISLANMSLSGTISPSIASLNSLVSLDIGQNSITGTIPNELLNCTNLQILNLSTNGLTGQLPDLSSLTSLILLDVSSNSLTGDFPAWVVKLTNLVQLGLAANQFNESEILESIGELKNLTWLFLNSCNLRGEIPESIFQLTSLGTLDLSMNHLTGIIPSSISNLNNLFKLELFQNNLTGVLPAELGSIAGLREIDVSRNQLSGELPAELGFLKNLTVFQIYRNNFWGELPSEFGNLKFLNAFSVYENKFTGLFPAELGRYSPMNSVDISENEFFGPFPKYLCQNNNLQYLLALNNKFSGEFPENYATCKTLVRFRISQNGFTGEVPDGLWGLPYAQIIDVSENYFAGKISAAVGMSASLTELNVQKNKFSGELPKELGNLSQLQKLIASSNSFSGPIPEEIGNLNQLTSLHLESNEISGSLPTELSMCNRLADLDVADNLLSGEIPESLAMLTSLNSLNLSGNMLTGSIPDGLQSLRLSSLDLSMNQLSGRVPPELLVIAGDEAFANNAGLCTDDLTKNRVTTLLSVCNLSQSHKRNSEKRLVYISILFALLVLSVLLAFASFKSFKFEELKKNKDLEEGSEEDTSWKLESFHPTEMDAEEICNVDDDNLIGDGANGKVYRLDLNKNRGTFAVKKLSKCKGEQVLMTEIDILGKIRHRNILKLYACLTRGKTNFLVFEYMPNGNLYQALRREVKGGKPELDWNKRYNIAIGAAKGLMYLHHDCSPAIIHRDIKSSNILLDENYEAKISDFGIAKVAENSDLTSFAGTHGYIAPELAYSIKLTEKSDIYSFGVVLLELISGRCVTESMYGEGKDIVYWVSTHLDSEKVLQVLDKKVCTYIEGDMIKVLKVAILCTAKLPSVRPTMRQVVNMLIDADPCNSFTSGKDHCKD